MKRIQTGIFGLDNKIGGGIPEKSSILICGSPGTGKSIFGLQYLYEGAIKYNEQGLYVTIEEKPENLKEQAKQFNWDFDKAKVEFVKIPIDEANVDIVDLIEKAVKKTKAKRVVIDSLSILSINAPMYRLPIKVKNASKFERTEIQPSALSGDSEIQQFIYIFVSRVTDLGTTVIFIADSPQMENYLTRDTVSEFACDGVIQLKMMEMGKTVNRTLEIKKLRKTKFETGLNLLSFSERGIEIKDFDY